MRSKFCRFLAFQLVLFFTVTGGIAVAAPKVGVLLSSNETAYLEAFAGFKATFDNGTVELVVLKLDKLTADQVADCAFVFTVGSQASAKALEALPGIPVIAAMVLRPQAMTSRTRLTGVYLEPPLRDQLAWYKAALPKLSRIGVLYHPSETGSLIPEAQKAADALGLKLVARPVGSAAEIAAVLQTLDGSIDLLWGISDSVVLNPTTARDILGFSLSSGVPLAAPSSTWVKAGALCGWDWDYRDIGAQAAKQGQRLLSGTPLAGIPPEKPRRTLYSLNLRTARMLGINFPKGLIDGASFIAGR